MRRTAIMAETTMNDAMRIATTGLQNTADRFQRNASAIVKATTTGEDKPGQLESAMVSQMTDTSTYKANANVVETANRMMGSLLDVIS